MIELGWYHRDRRLAKATKVTQEQIREYRYEVVRGSLRPGSLSQRRRYGFGDDELLQA